uniref:Uncharacterized protein n=1 Tax=Rhizophora mucronata TaxID=61149 RepID=A0A2P2PJI2_RHIMU
MLRQFSLRISMLSAILTYNLPFSLKPCSYHLSDLR